jgi:hypothetical protein
MFPCALLPFHEGVEQNSIRVTKRTNAKQPHHKGFVLVYLVKNEMPLIHHVGEW